MDVFIILRFLVVLEKSEVEAFLNFPTVPGYVGRAVETVTIKKLIEI